MSRLVPAAGVVVAVGAVLAACGAAPKRVISSQPSYGHDLPVAVPVATVGLDEPAGPVLNAQGGEVPKGLYTAPVETSGLDEPRPSGSS